MVWSPALVRVASPKNPEALADVRPLLERLVSGLGLKGAARLIDVDPAMLTRWRNAAAISPRMRRRITDLHDILNRAFQVFAPEVAMEWLIGSEPFLGGQRPIDVLAVHGAGPLVSALAAIERGDYA